MLTRPTQPVDPTATMTNNPVAATCMHIHLMFTWQQRLSQRSSGFRAPHNHRRSGQIPCQPPLVYHRLRQVTAPLTEGLPMLMWRHKEWHAAWNQALPPLHLNVRPHNMLPWLPSQRHSLTPTFDSESISIVILYHAVPPLVSGGHLLRYGASWPVSGWCFKWVWNSVKMALFFNLRKIPVIFGMVLW